jgi:hypothetical protein
LQETNVMKQILLIAALAFSATAAAQDMKPNKDPVPSPSDIRAATGEDRPQGTAREDRTPSPSDLATEAPRIDGDRRTDALQRPSTAASGGSAQPLPENNRGEPIRP